MLIYFSQRLYLSENNQLCIKKGQEKKIFKAVIKIQIESIDAKNVGVSEKIEGEVIGKLAKGQSGVDISLS